MKKTKAFAKTYDITKNLYYDHSLYEHDHKDTHTKDIVTLVRFSLRERRDKVAENAALTGLLIN